MTQTLEAPARARSAVTGALETSLLGGFDDSKHSISRPEKQESSRGPAAPTLSRQIFKTSRLAEFCSRKELVNQTGHAVEDWPLVILKELLDNALDACEEAVVAPVIGITLSEDAVAATDNGPGMTPETVEALLDYTCRVSSREAYVSPTRGAQGNALKTILAMGFALDGERGETLIESKGVAHRIEFSIDRIRQEPRITHARETSLVKTGTRITVKWPNSASSILDNAKPRFLQVAEDYAWFNPHVTLDAAAATDPAWKKWRPSESTSPHWYDAARLERLIGAYIARAENHREPCPTVREFVSEFRGLSGTAKARAICEAVGAARISLAEFYGEGRSERACALLAEMKKHSRPVKPKDLGAIGKDHLAAKFEGAGVAPATFEYRRAEFEHDGLPYLAETAFGYCPGSRPRRRIITGVNFSPAIGADPFQNLGPTGDSLSSILTKQRAGSDEPIVTVLHLTCPRIEYLDRGKSKIKIPGSRAW